MNSSVSTLYINEIEYDCKKLYSHEDIARIQSSSVYIRSKLEENLEILDLSTKSRLQYMFSQLRCVKVRDILKDSVFSQEQIMGMVWSWRMGDRDIRVKRRETNSFMLFKMDIGKLFEASKLMGQSLDQKHMNKIYSKIWNFLKSQKDHDNIYKHYMELTRYGKQYDQISYDFRKQAEGAAKALLVVQEAGHISHDSYMSILPLVQSCLVQDQPKSRRSLCEGIIQDLTYFPTVEVQQDESAYQTSPQ